VVELERLLHAQLLAQGDDQSLQSHLYGVATETDDRIDEGVVPLLRTDGVHQAFKRPSIAKRVRGPRWMERNVWIEGSPPPKESPLSVVSGWVIPGCLGFDYVTVPARS
jgi:hypothetical protein